MNSLIDKIKAAGYGDLSEMVLLDIEKAIYKVTQGDVKNVQVVGQANLSALLLKVLDAKPMVFYSFDCWAGVEYEVFFKFSRDVFYIHSVGYAHDGRRGQDFAEHKVLSNILKTPSLDDVAADMLGAGYTYFEAKPNSLFYTFLKIDKSSFKEIPLLKGIPVTIDLTLISPFRKAFGFDFENKVMVMSRHD